MFWQYENLMAELEPEFQRLHQLPENGASDVPRAAAEVNRQTDKGRHKSSKNLET